MKTVMVRYKTTEAYAPTNATLIHAVFDAIRARAPAGLHYAAYRSADAVTFVHIASMETDTANPLATLAAFQTFQRQLQAEGHCVEAPLVTELSAVDSYGQAP